MGDYHSGMVQIKKPALIKKNLNRAKTVQKHLFEIADHLE
jgi:hypothetical protein